MIKRSYRLQLAKMLKLYKEISTDNGVLTAEADEITVGTEVYIEQEGEMIPAPDGDYKSTSDNAVYTVTGGTITEIKYLDDEGVVADETKIDEFEDAEQSNNETTETGSTDEVQNDDKDAEIERLRQELAQKEEIVNALEAKVEQLENTVSDLEDQVAAYKAKEEEVNAPTADEAEKFESKKSGKMSEFDKKMNAARKLMKLN